MEINIMEIDCNENIPLWKYLDFYENRPRYMKINIFREDNFRNRHLWKYTSVDIASVGFYLCG